MQALVRMVERVITRSDRLSAHAQLDTMEIRVKMASRFFYSQYICMYNQFKTTNLNNLSKGLKETLLTLKINSMVKMKVFIDWGLLAVKSLCIEICRGFLPLLDINECDASPCQNERTWTCYNTVGSFICTCTIGYDGDTCQNGKELPEVLTLWLLCIYNASISSISLDSSVGKTPAQ